MREGARCSVGPGRSPLAAGTVVHRSARGLAVSAATPRKEAFTLIELLIVVAIIAILALIAVPNFLEAQTRAKVARSNNDLRTYAVALEAYCIDWNSYVNDHDSNFLAYSTLQNGFTRLTSPVAYMTSLPHDPFGWPRPLSAERNIAVYYEGGSGEDHPGDWGDGGRYPTAWARHAYLVLGIGPDQDDSTGGNDEFPWTDNMTSYDPTNGSISRGDIYRVMGDWKNGYIRDWDGRTYGKPPGT